MFFKHFSSLHTLEKKLNPQKKTTTLPKKQNQKTKQKNKQIQKN